MKKIVISALAFMFIATPMALAQFGIMGPRSNTTYVNDWVDQIILWSQRAVTFLMVIATIYFIVTVIRYIMDKGDKPENVKVKKNAMIRGIIGLAVMVGVWGIIRILLVTFGVGTGNGASFDPSCPPGQRYDSMQRICL